jgi:hypothetical protein
LQLDNTDSPMQWNSIVRIPKWSTSPLT